MSDTATVELPKFTEGTIPNSSAGRPEKPIQFLEPVRRLNDARDKDGVRAAKTLEFDVTAATPDELSDILKGYRADLTRAGRALDVTVRWKVTLSADKLAAHVAFWVLDRIVKTRKVTKPESK